MYKSLISLKISMKLIFVKKTLKLTQELKENPKIVVTVKQIKIIRNFTFNYFKLSKNTYSFYELVITLILKI